MMENHPILRSLVAEGRPLGTERSTSLPGHADPQADRFERHLDEARRAHEEPADRVEQRGTENHGSARSSRASQAQRSARHETTPTPSPSEPLTESDPIAAAELSALATSADDAIDPMTTLEASAMDESELGDVEFAAPPKPRANPRAAGSASSEPAIDEPSTLPELLDDTTQLLDVENGAAKLQIELEGEHAPRAPTTNATAAQTVTFEDPPIEASDALEGFGSETPALEEASFEGLASEIASELPDAELLKSSTARDATSPTLTPRDGEVRRVEHAIAAEPAAPAKPQTPVGTDRAADILRQIRLQISPEMRQATIQLEPRELGRISIRVTMRGDAVHAQVRVDRKETLDALEKQLPELRAALQRAGLGGGELALQLGLEERSPGDSARNGSSRDSHTSSTETNSAVPRELVRALAPRLTSSDGVDTYA